MMTERHLALSRAILLASEALDPHHQGPQWPDPFVWDGRDLTEQASDLLDLLESTIGQNMLDIESETSDVYPLVLAYEVLEVALHPE